MNSRELNAINMTLAEHDVWVAVGKKNKAGRPAMFVTPAYTVLSLMPYRPGVKLSSIRARLPEVQSVLARMRKDVTLRVRLDENAFALEIPNATVEPVLLTERVYGALPEYHAALGKQYSFNTVQRHAFNLADPEYAHILIAGTTGSGKSTLARSIVCTLAHATSPERLHLCMIDPKREGLRAFRDLPHVAYWTGDHAQGARLIAWLADEVQRRVDAEIDEPANRYVLVIDEIAELVDSGENIERIATIARMGRSVGVHLIAMAQNPSKTLFGSELGAQLRSQFKTKVVFHLEDADIARAVTGRAKSGAEKLPGAGAALLIDGGLEPQRIQCYLLENVERMVGCIAQKWQGLQAPQISLALEPMHIAHRKGRNFMEDVERAKPVFEQFYRWDVGGGALVQGGKKAIIEAVFGKGEQTGGHRDKHASKIIEYLEGNP